MHRDSEQVDQLNAYLSKMVNKCLEYSREAKSDFYSQLGLYSGRHHGRYLPLPLHGGRKSGKACASFPSLQNRGGVYSSGQ